MNRILCYVALSPVVPRIHKRTLDSIMGLIWPGKLDIVFGRNETPATWHKYDDLANKHNEARQMCLDGGYDSLLFIENDMIVHPEALRALDAVNADVAYGLYVGRHEPYRWLSFIVLDGLSGAVVSQSPELMRECWGKIYETKGVGFGCTLVRRHVLEAITFRTHPENKVADDWMFALDCRDKGFRSAHHFGVQCGHITPNGVVLWPTINDESGVRIEEFKE